MSLKDNICKKIISACLGKASLTLALGFILLNPVSAHAAPVCSYNDQPLINCTCLQYGTDPDTGAQVCENQQCDHNPDVSFFRWYATNNGQFNGGGEYFLGKNKTGLADWVGEDFRAPDFPANFTLSNGVKLTRGAKAVEYFPTANNGYKSYTDFQVCVEAAPTSCTLGNEEELNDWDGAPGTGFNTSHAEGGPCVASQYMAPANRFLEGNFVGCSDTGANTSAVKNPGPHAGTTVNGATTGCISRVWRNGSSNSNATQCKVFGYRCAGGGTPRVDGACSTTANQCTYGVYTDDVTDTATEYKWHCNGTGGGTNSGVCTAAKEIPGVCGYASGRTYTSSPAAADSLCTTGTPSTVTGDGSTGNPWSWSCSGQNGGAAASCGANICLPPVDGVCNNASQNSCARGDVTNTSETSTAWNWHCAGQNGGATATNCTRSKPGADGVCDESAENRCSAGTLNDTVDSGTHFLWQCMATGSSTVSDNCSLEKPASQPGACSTTSHDGCLNGSTWTDGTDDASYFRWSCTGINGGSTVPCQLAKPTSYTYAWEAGGFGSCSATCGGGTQSRNVDCKRSDGQTVADSFCTGTKPATSQSCNTQPCGTCSTGFQITSWDDDGGGDWLADVSQGGTWKGQPLQFSGAHNNAPTYGEVIATIGGEQVRLGYPVDGQSCGLIPYGNGPNPDCEFTVYTGGATPPAASSCSTAPPPPTAQCPSGSTYAATPSSWPANNAPPQSWLADGTRIAGAGNPTGGASHEGSVQNVYNDLPMGVPVAPSCGNGLTVGTVRNYRITGCRNYNPSPDGKGYSDVLMWDCTGATGVCQATQQFGQVFCT